MSRRNLVGVGLAVLWIATASSSWGAAKPAATSGPSCPCPNCTDQTPRKLETTQHSAVSIVKQGPNDTVLYTPRAGGATRTLGRCSQHYHGKVENRQPQCDSANLVEIHTAYSVEPKCVREDLSCCTQGPVVVMAYQATVTPGGERTPVPVIWDAPWAQWSGSSTGADSPADRCYGCPPPGACKGPAQWSFALGCDFKVSQAQLSPYHAEPSRALQPASRLSSDLTLVP
jgi:hypothetical protein